MPTRNEARRSAVWLIAIATAGFIAYSPALQNEFVNWDVSAYLDTPLIWDFPGNFTDFWTTPIAGNYHPLTMLTLAANYSFSGESPRGYILTNIVLHLVNSLLVFAFVALLTDRRILIAGITSLFFAIHPMHVESVAWIAERKDVLYTGFFLLALIAHLRHLESRRMRDAALTWVAFLLSLLAKPAAVVLPLCLVLVDFQRGRPIDARRLFFYAPFLLVSLAMGLVTLETQSVHGVAGAPRDFDFLSQCLFAAYGFVYYIAKLFIPLQQSAFVPYPTVGDAGTLPWIFQWAPLAVALIGGAAIYSLRRTRAIFFGLAFYLATVVLVLGFVSIGHTLVSERYTYLPYVGIFFIIGSFAAHLADQRGAWAKPLRRLLAGALLLFAGLCAALTYQRTQVWNTSETLWSDVIQKFPHAASLPYYSRAHHYRDAGDVEAALADYSVAIEIDPEFEDGYVSRGAMHAGEGNRVEALADFNRVLELNENSAVALEHRGRLRLQTGNASRALEDFEAALAVEPTGSRFLGRGIARLALGQKGAARRDFEQAIHRNVAVDPSLLESAAR